jgi:hypothetical protein
MFSSLMVFKVFTVAIAPVLSLNTTKELEIGVMNGTMG